MPWVIVTVCEQPAVRVSGRGSHDMNGSPSILVLAHPPFRSFNPRDESSQSPPRIDDPQPWSGPWAELPSSSGLQTLSRADSAYHQLITRTLDWPGIHYFSYIGPIVQSSLFDCPYTTRGQRRAESLLHANCPSSSLQMLPSIPQ